VNLIAPAIAKTTDVTPGQARFEYLLRLGDTSLVLAQRLGEWVGHAPALEEDLGLANIALDLIGQARLLLSYAGELEGCGRDEDALAFQRDVPEFRNFALVEQPNGDFGFTIVRQFLLDGFQRELYAGLARSADERLAAIAVKALKETDYHWRFSSRWLVRLGDGTEESHARVLQALEVLWPYTNELFDGDAIDRAMAEAGVAPALAVLEPRWRALVNPVINEAALAVPQEQGKRTGGKRGMHGEALGFLLAEMQFLQRAYPGAQW
jgi:ring-1,2-phenylacetyl-CoA epoxidase subunit PaaC